MLGEPQPTQADIHFNVAGFPVRVSPWFWAVSLLLGLRSFDGEPVGSLLSVGVVFVSILVHELGHAVMQRRYGGYPRIVLHGFGGLAMCGDCDRSPRRQILISFAGPLAGFLLAAIALGVLWSVSGYLTIELAGSTGEWRSQLDPAIERRLIPVSLFGFTVWYVALSSVSMNVLFIMLLWINVVWGLINLLPVYPLDGGQIARELFTLRGDPQQGIIRSLQLSIATGAVMAAVGLLTMGSLLTALLFGFLAYSNYRTLQAYTGRGPGYGW